jgi:hypothetical protein
MSLIGGLKRDIRGPVLFRLVSRHGILSIISKQMQTKITLLPSWLIEFLSVRQKRRDYNEDRAHSSLNQLTRKHFVLSAMKALEVCILHGPAGLDVHHFGFLPLNTPSHKIMRAGRASGGTNACRDPHGSLQGKSQYLQCAI